VIINLKKWKIRKKILKKIEELEEDMSLLNEEQKRELQKLADEVLREARLVVDDFNNNPSEESGSIIQVHQDSPLLDNDEDDE
tara:strand:+ start:332 stop:580 length:249 start_codon:yes stop_codon:yes gene_type:complete